MLFLTCRVRVKLQLPIVGATLEHAEATFSSSTGLATVSKMRIHLRTMGKVRLLLRRCQRNACSSVS